MIVAVIVMAIVMLAAFVTWYARTPDRVRGESKSYGLPATTINVEVNQDGSADVVERITFDFNGEFKGAFRDLPVRAEDEIEEVFVCDEVEELDGMVESDPRCPEGMKPFVPGASTELGSFGMPGTFGRTRITNPDGADEPVPALERVVWHYHAQGGLRTFAIGYRAHGWLRRTGTDTGDPLALTLSPWGTEWGAAVSSLEATITLPSSVSRQDVRDVFVASHGAGDVAATARRGERCIRDR